MIDHSDVSIRYLDVLSKKMILNLLKKIQYGVIQVNDGKNSYVFGQSDSNGKETVTMTIRHPRVYKKILLEGTVGAGKSYIDGDWTTCNLQKLIELIIKNDSIFNRIESPVSRLINSIRTMSAKLNRNTIQKAKDNILAHYDLGNDFFQIILDSSMMYSCAVYQNYDDNLETAAKHKIQTICKKLQLKPSDHLLEIGSGWGGFAIHAAQVYGCRITTTTISDKQYAYVKEKIKQLGLENQIELLNRDYRKLSGQYDKLVSIEMIEAVGDKYFDTFFHQCNRLVKPGGLFFLQAIVINDQAFESAKNEIDFIKKYIFPGGCLPSVFSIAQSIATQTSMQLIAFEDIGKHYVTTLNDWHQKLLTNKDDILAQGFNEDFIRMWEFYFCYSAAGFESQYISNIHILWQKR